MKLLNIAMIAVAAGIAGSAHAASTSTPIVDRANFSSVPWAKPPQQPHLQKVQYGVMCFANNSFGVTFHWYGPNAYVAANNVMRACRVHTPVGGVCVFDHCE